MSFKDQSVTFSRRQGVSNFGSETLVWMIQANFNCMWWFTPRCCGGISIQKSENIKLEDKLFYSFEVEVLKQLSANVEQMSRISRYVDFSVPRHKDTCSFNVTMPHIFEQSVQWW